MPSKTMANKNISKDTIRAKIQMTAAGMAAVIMVVAMAVVMAVVIWAEEISRLNNSLVDAIMVMNREPPTAGFGFSRCTELSVLL